MQYNKKLNKNNSGFSLIELIVTVVILALVTAPFLSSFITASNTNLKAKRIEAANEISQEIIERFKGSDISYVKGVYGMTDGTDPSGAPISTVNNVNCNGTIISGYKGYTADITIKGGTTVSDANGGSPVIDDVSSNSCAFIATNLYQYDLVYISNPNIRRKVDVTISYDDGLSDPSQLGYHIKVESSYWDSGTQRGVGVNADYKFDDLPTVYMVYKPLSANFDEIHFKNNLTDAQLSGNKIPIYLINQKTYGNVHPANVYINEEGTPVDIYSLECYNHVPGVTSKDLSKTTLNTNIITANTGTVNLNDVVREENIDYLYEMTVQIKYGSKVISTYTASKNIVD